MGKLNGRRKPWVEHLVLELEFSEDIANRAILTALNLDDAISIANDFNQSR